MLAAARAIVVAAAAMFVTSPTQAEPLVKWIEPSYTVHHHGIDDWHSETYWVFEQVYDWNWCRYFYRQRQITIWEWREIEIPPRSEYDEEP